MGEVLFCHCHNYHVCCSCGHPNFYSHFPPYLFHQNISQFPENCCLYQFSLIIVQPVSQVSKELDHIFQVSDHSATMKDLHEMRYLQRVIKESLRLYQGVLFFAIKIWYMENRLNIQEPDGYYFCDYYCYYFSVLADLYCHK